MNIRFNKVLKVALFLLATFALLLGALNVSPSIVQAQGRQDDPTPSDLKTKLCDGSILQAATFMLDGVTLNLCTAFLPGPFVSSEADNSMQVATAVNPDRFEELSVMAVPFGTKLPSEDLPIAKSGMEGQYRKLLQKARVAQGGSPQTGPTIAIFGKQVVGSTSLVNLAIDISGLKPVLVTEWVVEAGKRLWIVRASQEYSAGATASQQASTANTLSSQFSMSGSNLNQPSTLIQSLENESVPAQDAPTGVGDVIPGGLAYPTPSWWHGVCDTNYYYARSGHKKAYPLGGSYQGVKACGPRPYYNEGPDVLVTFFSGAHGEYEWECVELSMRYLYLAYAIKPYRANGKDVVPNYKGTKLVKISNGKVGSAPQPGDVLSYGATSTFGHTSVVSASNVNTSGNGTITVIEQNASVKGTKIHKVANWRVQNGQAVVGWLHKPTPRTITATPTRTVTATNMQTTTPTYTPTVNTPVVTFTPTPTVTFTPTKTLTPTIPAPIIVNPVLAPLYGTCTGSSWYKIAGAGYGATDLYLTLNTNVPANSTNSAKWTPNFPLAGKWKVETFVAFHNQITWQCSPNTTIGYDTSDAQYKVYLNGSVQPTVKIDQKPLVDQWATIGTYNFSAGTGSYITLIDLNSEAQLTRTVSFNVLRFTYMGP